MSHIKEFNNLHKEDAHFAGGKAASLGEMYNAGIPVPDGFVILPLAEENEILEAYNKLGAEYVAVRSSATAEDGHEHAWAGQLESFLNVSKENLLEKIKLCQESISSERAKSYRKEKGLDDTSIAVAVIVQKMVKAETAGVAFSVHPVTEDTNQIIIEVVNGLGESLVDGSQTPDSYVVAKDSHEIVCKNLAGSEQVLNDDQIIELSKLILKIEKHFGFPSDIEWAYEEGKFYIVQSRPITTLGRHSEKGRKTEKWIQDRHFNAFLVEESLVLLLRDKFFLQILGATYRNGISVNKIGDFLIESEENMMKEARAKVLKPVFNYISKINKLEEEIKVLVPAAESVEDFIYIFELMSEHLAYYGLGKEEAELIFINENTSEDDKKYIENWRNDKGRWYPHDELWKKIAQKTNVSIELIHVMLIEEIIDLLRGDSIDLESIEKRINAPWSLVQKDGIVSFYLENKSPLRDEGDLIHGVSGQVAYSNGTILEGVVGQDILVVRKTHPGMIDQIRNSRAVVTDEGGILSHAAITAREFNIPTIIGTKRATMTFKEGDHLEVDTVSGHVRLSGK